MAHPDLEALLNPLLSFAQEQLSKRGGFLPFAASMSLAGEIALVAGDVGKGQPEPSELIEFLVQTLRQEAAAGKIRATGICVDMQVVPPGTPQKTDAICAQLEHKGGQNADVCLPYRKGFLGRLKYGELFAASRDGRIFVAGPSEQPPQPTSGWTIEAE